MTVPGLGVVSLAGFAHRPLLLLALVPVGLVALYVVAQSRRSHRMRRFADPELVDSVVPRRAHPWRHVPMALLAAALLLLTIALAGPTHDQRVPRNRAVIMLVIDVSQSMRATDVAPSRLAAAQQAAKRFAQQLTPGVNLGLVAFAGTPNVLVSPTPDHQATVAALDNLRPADATATGDAIFAALDSIATVAAVLGSGNTTPPPARIVLESDGKETKPTHPDDLRGAYTAARTAKDRGIPISTITFGTKAGRVEVNNQQLPVPVDGSMMNKIATLSGGQSYTATNVDDVNRSYAAVQQQVGYENVPGPAGAAWLRLAVLVATVAALLAVVVNRRLPA
ncbi:VWA domain-containing protein [Mycobacterium sp.]|uniref:VWA domain-containing protein n=1 Tax=Mycobacterium sp. TaxID=1785 RepID=UPI002D403DA3|nr:VWA domain-containing protein [Mycobacterium sp.]HZA08451.1 VWA domain-containing protein [Mycobacterium sp.]